MSNESIVKILILEDNQERINVFRQKLEADGVEVMFTEIVDECIELLKDNEYQYLMLDHDLGGNIYVESDGDELTGWHVAKWLSEHPDRQPETIIVHSLNEGGRKRILSLLPNALDVPGAWLVVGLKDNTK